jgi:hypothetical protein
MAINVLAERDGNAGLGIAPFVGFEQVAHDDLGLDEIGNLDADGAFAGNGREDVDALGLERGGDVVRERGDLFQLHAGRGMQFVARDGRAFGDVAERNLDVELRERLLHEPRVGHQLLLGLGRLDRHVRVLEKIHRRQLVIADHRRRGDGDGLRFAGPRLCGAMPVILISGSGFSSAGLSDSTLSAAVSSTFDSADFASSDFSGSRFLRLSCREFRRLWRRRLLLRKLLRLHRRFGATGS